MFTRRGIERIARYAFTLARSRPRKLLASATKSNALHHALVMWDEVVAGVAAEFPDVTFRKYHVDALAARMITHPQSLDVIVASNLFGDILTDIGSAISGSLGVGPSGNINPDRTTPSMFEPIHGSAPDIAGKGVANPIAAIWAGAMMLDHLGERAAHDSILRAIEQVIGDERVKTPDLGGRATTAEMTAAVTSALSAQPRLNHERQARYSRNQSCRAVTAVERWHERDPKEHKDESRRSRPLAIQLSVVIFVYFVAMPAAAGAKLTLTLIRVSTTRPFNVVGVNSHSPTASSAARSNAGCGDEITRMSFIRPSMPICPSIDTVPRIADSLSAGG